MKLAVIGGGASGLACAIEACRSAKKQNISIGVTVFEANDRVGKKLLATGNGRCNMTNIKISPAFYFGNRSFSKAALEKYPPESNIAFFESMGLYSKADSEGRVYPLSNQASGVLDALRFECERLGVVFRCGEKVKEITPFKGRYKINEAELFDAVVLACGGAAAVKDYNGYRLLASLGHSVTKTSPSLVKLTTPLQLTKQLKGLRAFVKMTLRVGQKIIHEESGELLFGDFSLSGIAAMQLSAYVTRHFQKSKVHPTVSVDFVPTMSFDFLVGALKKICANAGNTSCENLLYGFMPKRIGSVIVKQAGFSPSEPISRLSGKDIKKIAALCKSFDFEIDGTKGFFEAQVTAGGAKTDEFDSRTLQSKLHKGLFCCGEMLDVDALCGGYNLQWAWSSGRLCGKSCLEKGR